MGNGFARRIVLTKTLKRRRLKSSIPMVLSLIIALIKNLRMREKKRQMLK